MLSLSPRYDQFRFLFPKEFLPPEVTEKWQRKINKDSAVITTPIDYLNESIRGVTFPGMSDLTVTQQQHSTNAIKRTLGRINVEPNQNNTTYATGNPLDKIQREITVKFRMNQGLYNYWMLYETIFYRYCKPELYKDGDNLEIYILDEDGTRCARVSLEQCHISGIDGLDFSFDKSDRQVDEFSLTIVFNNIDLDLLDEVS